MKSNDTSQAERLDQRTDYRLILEIVPEGSRVLDLGCGSGGLLDLLRERRQVRGYGVELSSRHIADCIGRGLSVFHGDLDEGLRDFEDQSFDYVIVNQTLSVTHCPDLVVAEMLRVGRRGIVGFANFAHWQVRLRLLLSGRMPVTEAVPYEWYDTPNIHHFSIKDFRIFCRRREARIIDEYFFDRIEDGRPRRHLCCPNWRAAYSLFVLEADT